MLSAQSGVTDMAVPSSIHPHVAEHLINRTNASVGMNFDLKMKAELPKVVYEIKLDYN